MNSVNYTNVMVEFVADVVLEPSGLRRQVVERKQAGEPFGFRIADVLPQSQIDAPEWQDQNARVTLTCNGGQIPCPATAANWYGTELGSVSTPRYAYSVQPVCQP